MKDYKIKKVTFRGPSSYYPYVTVDLYGYEIEAKTIDERKVNFFIIGSSVIGGGRCWEQFYSLKDYLAGGESINWATSRQRLINIITSTSKRESSKDFSLADKKFEIKTLKKEIEELKKVKEAMAISMFFLEKNELKMFIWVFKWLANVVGLNSKIDEVGNGVL